MKISSNNPLRRYNTTIMISVQRVLATGRISVYVDKDGSFLICQQAVYVLLFQVGPQIFLTLQVTYLMVLVPDNDCQPRPDTVSVVENI